MKTLHEFREFYETQLLPYLHVLEKRRKRTFFRIAYVTVGAFSIAGVLILLAAVKVLDFSFSIILSLIIDFSPYVIFSLLAAVAIAALAEWFFSRSYKKEFKTYVIKRIVRFIDNRLSYKADGLIPKSQFHGSEIFSTVVIRYKGDDLVWGKIGQTEIKFSELDVRGQGRLGRNGTNIVFKGLFFIGDFNKQFQGRTVVLPKVPEKLLGRIGHVLQNCILLNNDIVRLEDPDFEKYFVVYSSDQVEARYVLSTSLIKRIVDFKRKTGREIRLSFVRSRVYVAVSYTHDMFEPRLYSTLLNFSLIADYLRDLQLAVGIVKDLNLNARIWTKE